MLHTSQAQCLPLYLILGPWGSLKMLLYTPGSGGACLQSQNSGGRGRCIFEFQVSLFSRASFRTDRATQRTLSRGGEVLPSCHHYEQKLKGFCSKPKEGTADLQEETCVYHSPIRYHTANSLWPIDASKCKEHAQDTLLGRNFLPSAEVSVVLKQECLGFSDCHRGTGRAKKTRDAGTQHGWHQMTPQEGIFWPKF